MNVTSLNKYKNIVIEKVKYNLENNNKVKIGIATAKFLIILYVIYFSMTHITLVGIPLVGIYDLVR